MTRVKKNNTKTPPVAWRPLGESKTVYASTVVVKLFYEEKNTNATFAVDTKALQAAEAPFLVQGQD